MKKLALALSVFMMVIMSAVFVMAAEKKQVAQLESLEGEVMSIDISGGQIVFLTTDNQKEVLKADPRIIEDIAIGEQITIEKAGDVIKSIKKSEVTPPPIE
ncbi:MAG: hypothetical protein KJ737_15680 [Proteobacteria bacterium]|nr:hypothetical protein [Pseudomonadota bacterium]